MIARGPYFDELRRGRVFDGAPSLTLTSGGAALHQAIVGDRLAVGTDHELGRALADAPLAHPAYVWDVAIGQSTTATYFVKANLFYRDLAFRRFPVLGDTLTTTATVVALKQNTPRPGRALTGLAALRVHTSDQLGRPVLDFHRCAMLPLTPGSPPTDHADDLDAVGTPARSDTSASPPHPDLLAALAAAPGRRPGPVLPAPGTTVEVWGGDVVSSAPELARLTLNVAHVHHDARAGGGRRLVYGGHTIGIAAAQLTRALPGVRTFVRWTSCDHTGPVYEGDTLRSTLTVEGVESLDTYLGRGAAVGGRADVDEHRPDGHRAAVAHLRSVVRADPVSDADDPQGRPVLDWRVSVLA